MDVLVINLEKSKDRWENVLMASRNQKYNLIRIDGIYGKELDLNTVDVLTDFSKKYIPRGIIGCYLSHRKSWEYIVKNNLKGAIILEDDFTIPDGIDVVNEMYKLQPFIPSNTDVLLLGCLSCDINTDFISIVTASSRPDKGHINDYVYKPSQFAGLFAYYVTNKGARKLLDSFKHDIWHVDIMISRNKNINLYSLKNHIFTVNFTKAFDSLNDTPKNKLLHYVDSINMSCVNMPSVSLGWTLSSSLFRINEFVIKLYHVVAFLLLLIIIISIYKLKSSRKILI